MKRGRGRPPKNGSVSASGTESPTSSTKENLGIERDLAKLDIAKITKTRSFSRNRKSTTLSPRKTDLQTDLAKVEIAKITKSRSISRKSITISPRKADPQRDLAKVEIAKNVETAKITKSRSISRKSITISPRKADAQIQRTLPVASPVKKLSIKKESSRCSVEPRKRSDRSEEETTQLIHPSTHKDMDVKSVKDLWTEGKMRDRFRRTPSVPLFRALSHPLLSDEKTQRRTKKGVLIKPVVRGIKNKLLRSSISKIICVDLDYLTNPHIHGGDSTVSIEVMVVKCSKRGVVVENMGSHHVSIGTKTTDNRPVFLELTLETEELDEMKSMFMVTRLELSRASSTKRGNRRASLLRNADDEETDAFLNVHLLMDNTSDGSSGIVYAVTGVGLIMIKEPTTFAVDTQWMSSVDQLSWVRKQIKKTLDASDHPCLHIKVSSEYNDDDDSVRQKKKKIKVEEVETEVTKIRKNIKFVTVSEDNEGDVDVLDELNTIRCPFTSRCFKSIDMLSYYLNCTTRLFFSVTENSGENVIIEVKKEGDIEELPIPKRPLQKKIEGESVGDAPEFGYNIKALKDLVKNPPKPLKYGPVKDAAAVFGIHHEPRRGIKFDEPAQRAVPTYHWTNFWDFLKLADYSDVPNVEKEFMITWNLFLKPRQIIRGALWELWDNLKEFRTTYYMEHISKKNPDMMRQWLTFLRVLVKYQKITLDMEIALITGDFSKLSEMKYRIRKPSSKDGSDQGSLHSRDSTPPVRNGRKKRNSETIVLVPEVKVPERRKRARTNCH